MQPSEFINIIGGVHTARGLFSINRVYVLGINKFWQYIYILTDFFQKQNVPLITGTAVLVGTEAPPQH